MNDTKYLRDIISRLNDDNVKLTIENEKLLLALKDAYGKIADLTHKIECVIEEQFDPMRDGWVGKDGKP